MEIKKKALAMSLLGAFVISLSSCTGTLNPMPPADYYAPKATASPKTERASEGSSSKSSGSSKPSSSSSKSYGSSSGSSSKSSSSSSKSYGSSSKSKSSGSSSKSEQSFEDYLKENDPDSYKYYKDLEKGYNSGSYSKEDGFSSKSSSSKSKSKSSSKSNQSFEDYLKENDPDSYKYYKGLEKGYNSGSYSRENGYYKK